MSGRKVAGRVPARQDGRDRWRLCAGLCIALALAAAPASRAAETITDFQSDITVAKDGSLSVRETISVTVEHQAILHGIFRVLPVDSTLAPVKVDGVEMDGHAEPYEIVSDPDAERIKIGDKDTLLALGLHRYTITYTIADRVAFRDDHDELHWSVTGAGWNFPIAHAAATIHLPSSAAVMRYRMSLDQADADPQAANATAGPGMISFQTMQELFPGQDFSVEVYFPKGVVDARAAP